MALYSNLLYYKETPPELKFHDVGVPVVAQQVKNLTSIHEDLGSIPALPQCDRDPALLQGVV